MIGTTLGSYVLDRELGRGGMGAVYVAKHTLLGRTAAIKVLLPELSKNQDIVQRFFNEARAATAIKHPGIVEIYDFGFAQDGSAFIVMEFLEGESLSARMRRFGKVAPAFAVAVARQIATALGVAHKAGIVHRDLKPDNVFLVPDAEIAIGERIKLLDFGIAKLAGDTGPGNVARTSTGMIMGTPYYMSPEQCRGAGQVDARSDLYALGCMLYEMIGGRVPFVAEGAGDIIAAHLLLPPAPLSTLAPVPEGVEALVMRLLAKLPADRPQTAEACAQELAALGQGLGLTPSVPPRAPDPPAVASPVSSQAKIETVAQPPPRPSPTTLGGSAGQELERPRPRRTGLILGVAVIALAAAAGGAFVLTRPSSARRAAQHAASDDPTTPRGATEDVHLIAARTAIETHMWTEGVIAAQAALQTDPNSAEAQAIVARARAEGAAEVATNAMTASIAAHDLVTAAARLAAIPDDSIYHQAALRDLTAAREQLVLDRTPEVKGLIAGGKCKEAKAVVADLTLAAGTGPTESLTRAAAQCEGGKARGGASAGGVAATPDAKPVTVAPTALEELRVAGDRNIAPDDVTKAEIQRAGKSRIVLPVKLCVTAKGAVASAHVVKSSGFPRYDAQIEREMRTWRYRPFVVDGQPVPVCTAITMIYAQR